MDGLELRYLRSFLVIAEELHFGRAAARLHLAQPSLSHQLQRLERQVGVELVARSSREVRLTPAGMAFETQARRLLEGAEHAVAVARQAAAGYAGAITVGFNFAAGRRVLTSTLRRFGETHPGVVTTLWEARSGPLLAAVADGRIDVALSFAGPVTAPLRARRLATVPLALVAGGLHPWARRRRVWFRELAGQQVVMFRRECSPVMHDAIHAAAGRSGIGLTVIDHIDDSGALSVVVATRPVLAFATTEGARTPGAGLVGVTLADPPTVELSAVWRADAPPAVGLFLDCLDTPHTLSETG